MAFSCWRLSCGKQSPPWQAVSVTHKHGGQEHAAELGLGFLITEAHKLKVYLQDGETDSLVFLREEAFPLSALIRFTLFFAVFSGQTSIVMFLAERQRGKEYK